MVRFDDAQDLPDGGRPAGADGLRRLTGHGVDRPDQAHADDSGTFFGPVFIHRFAGYDRVRNQLVDGRYDHTLSSRHHRERG
ncbi:MAG: hypothetical protein WB239_15055 [Acidimicrobiia bacterium]